MSPRPVSRPLGKLPAALRRGYLTPFRLYQYLRHGNRCRLANAGTAICVIPVGQYEPEEETMSAILSTLPYPPITPIHLDRGKPVASVSHLSPALNRRSSPSSATSVAMSKEPEDARLTGGTRSLERRLLALNLAQPYRLIA